MNIRSMTGYAQVHGTHEGIEFTISLKSVNHRGLDLRFQMSSDLDIFEADLRAAIKKQVLRGHVEVRVNIARAGNDASAGLDLAKLDRYVAAFREASRRHGIEGPPDLSAILRMPGVWTDGACVLPETLAQPVLQALLQAMDQCLEKLNEFRLREGTEIAQGMLERSGKIDREAQRMRLLRDQVLPGLHARLSQKLADLLGQAGVDPQRLAQEAALLADRGDIGEEIERLLIHNRQLALNIENESEAGKKLDFLLQEMNRETNTILSKTAGAGDAALEITRCALDVKSEIEKNREQALNLE